MRVFLMSALCSIGALACTSTEPQPEHSPQSSVEVPLSNRPFNTPDWAKTANIYELNVRQYTPEGTFAAVRPHLPRLRDMGVDVVWFMPIYPISEAKRKGTMGSYYSSSDFQSVNPEFGTLEEFKSIVDEIHGLGMHVILDWTANHTGWDHPWITEHPEYYVRREGTDTIRHAFNPNDGNETDWYDIAQLDYSNPELTPAMIDQMRFWRREAGIDGFRCDVAGFVPIDFWYAARPELEKDGPLFMLAEWGDEPRHFEAAFDINYGWAFHQLLNRIAEGEEADPVQAIWAYQAQDTAEFAPYAYHLNFTSNHDENSWNGTEYERMGELADALWVVCATFEGAPLVYSGQEEPLKRRLAFFEKDDIGFGDYAKADFFRTFLELKDATTALHNGEAGALAQRVDAGAEGVLAYKRTDTNGGILVAVNLGDGRQSVNLDVFGEDGTWRNVVSERARDLDTPGGTLALNRGEFVVLHRR